MIPALTVLGLVVNHAAFHFHFANRIITLEVGGVVVGIPQAKFNCRENRQVRRFRAVVDESQFPDFEAFTQWDEVTGVGFNISQPGADGCVAKIVAAFVEIQGVASRLPCR